MNNFIYASKIIGRRGIKYSNNFRFLKISKFHFSETPKTMLEKMRVIIDREKQATLGKEEDIKFIEEKTFPLTIHTQNIRLPIYLTIPLNLFLNPFSLEYNVSLLFSNYYLIFLTCFEAAQLISLGLNQYKLMIMNEKVENNDFIAFRNKVTRKRLAPLIIFFFSLLISATLASQYSNIASLVVLALSNIYLYVKFSVHITLHGLPKAVFERRMKNLLMNLVLIVLLGIIYKKNEKIVKNNLLYSI